MVDLSIIVIGKNSDVRKDKNVEFIYTKGINIKRLLKIARGKYVTFIQEEDKISKDYLKLVLDKTKEDFDSCFINYIIEYKYKKDVKLSVNAEELSSIKPYYNEYLWSFIFKKSKLFKVMDINDPETFNKKVDELFVKRTAIGNLIYYHNPKGVKEVKDFPYTDNKKNEYHKNIIYVGSGCAGIFNGYVSWVTNLGRCFGKKYDVVVLYDQINKKVLDSFSKYFKCVERKNNTNYYCDSLLVTYSTYYYPKNIITLDDSYMFIHGNMSDYPHSRVFHDDIYSHYVAVSKIAAKKAVGYFPTKNIEYVLNPFKVERSLVKPHLKLTSAFKYSDVKRPDRVIKMARILDELEIPYTWNVFTDQKENTNISGLIFRNRVLNPLPYIKDSDYFVLLSDSEAMPYCILEALGVNTKVIVTDLEAYKELGIKNNRNGVIIPTDYFDDNNVKKLKRVIRKLYKEKDKKIRYKFNSKAWDKYNEIFKK